MKYFGFDAKYSPFDLGNDAMFYNYPDGRNGIAINKSAFDSYDILKQSYMKEVFHQKRYHAGKIEHGNIGVSSIDILPEELAGAKYQYRNQGLYSNSPSKHFQIIGNVERSMSINGFNVKPFVKRWWHCLYYIPRRY